MAINRKEFIAKACLAGACMCGFGLPVFAGAKKSQSLNEPEPEKDKIFVQNWIGNLLNNLNNDVGQHDLGSIIKRNAEIHFNDLKMNVMLSEYVGKPEKFIAFLSENWGWKVEYNKETKTVVANENKSYCVCPVMKQADAITSSAICYCSEGFAEKMFSVVFNSPVSATVVSSVLRGDKNCIYKIIVS
jgi:predicted hydrocarbon binding protein